eukprot:366122-Chlamydomonas_euryale.AAC.3
MHTRAPALGTLLDALLVCHGCFHSLTLTGCREVSGHGPCLAITDARLLAPCLPGECSTRWHEACARLLGSAYQAGTNRVGGEGGGNILLPYFLGEEGGRCCYTLLILLLQTQDTDTMPCRGWQRPSERQLRHSARSWRAAQTDGPPSGSQASPSVRAASRSHATLGTMMRPGVWSARICCTVACGSPGRWEAA